MITIVFYTAIIPPLMDYLALPFARLIKFTLKRVNITWNRNADVADNVDDDIEAISSVCSMIGK